MSSQSQMRKRQRTDMSTAPDVHSPQSLPSGQVADDAFINDQEAADSGGDDDDDDDKPKSDKKAGRRKIKIEFIQDKSRRHITFSKRKAGIMKKAYELSTLTGTQVLLLVVSETGLVYTFTTAKLQPLVTQPEGKNLIQACLNAPQGTHPSNQPVGAPIGRSSGPAPSNNLPGGIAIAASKDESVNEDEEEHQSPSGRSAASGDKRRRRPSTGGSNAANTSRNSITSPPLSHSAIPSNAQSQQIHQQPTSQLPISPPQPHQQIPPNPQYYGHHQAQQARQEAQQAEYQPQHHQPQQDYGSMMPSTGTYSYVPPTGPTAPPGSAGSVQASQSQHAHWPQPQQPPPHYNTRR